MALTTLYNSTNHPLTWDKVNEVLKVVDDNFLFVNSQATTGILTNLTQDITPAWGASYNIGSPTQRWDNIYANNVDVGSITADVTGSVFADDSSMIIDATGNTISTNSITFSGGMSINDANNDFTFDASNGATNIINFKVDGGDVYIDANGVLQAGQGVVGNLTGNVTGNVSGNAGTVTNGVYTAGDQTIAGVKTFSNTIVGNTQGTHTGGVVGNVIGNIDGDVTGSVYSEDSSGVLVDGLHGVLNTYKLDQVGATDGQALVWDAANVRWQPGAAAGGGGTGLGSRTTKSASTSSIADGVTATTNITGAFKGYMVLKLQVDAAAWVRVYTDQASRTADASRLETDDPAPGAGVVVETITTGADTVLISPAVLGFNNESPVTDVIPISVKNKSGGTRTFTVTLTLIQLEA